MLYDSPERSFFAMNITSMYLLQTLFEFTTTYLDLLKPELVVDSKSETNDKTLYPLPVVNKKCSL